MFDLEISREKAEKELIDYGHSLPYEIFCKELKHEDGIEWGRVVPDHLKNNCLPNFMKTFSIKWIGQEIKGWFN